MKSRTVLAWLSGVFLVLGLLGMTLAALDGHAIHGATVLTALGFAGVAVLATLDAVAPQ